jgi:hypothetical protein
MAATAPQQVIYGHDRKLDAMLKKGEPYAP